MSLLDQIKDELVEDELKHQFEEENSYPYGIKKIDDKYVLNVKIYGSYEATYSSKNLFLLIKFYERNQKAFEMEV